MRKRQKKKRIRRLMAQAEALLREADSRPLIMLPTNWRRDDFDPKDYEFKVRSYYKPPINFIAYGKL